SLLHLDAAIFFDKAGIKADAVPFNGASEQINALLGNHIDVGTGDIASTQQLVKDGKIRIIGVFTDKRDPREALKDVPTFKENGYDVALAVWKWLYVPKDTPKESRDKLYEGFKKILDDPRMEEFKQKFSVVMEPITPDEIKAKVAKDTETTKAALDSLGLLKK
ncbi:MAG: Bug family tripartite tricarboxylate transporter substrate binding protein, partial [Clostridia bacterium]